MNVNFIYVPAFAWPQPLNWEVEYHLINKDQKIKEKERDRDTYSRVT